jgi:aminopeptidase
VSLDPGPFAALLCDYCLEVRAKQQVLVQSTTLAAPLLLALQRAVLEREAWPLLRVALPEQEVGFWAAAREMHLDTVPSSDVAEAEAIDALLRIDAPANTRALAAVDPARLTRAARARAGLREVLLSRRWCGTLWPTPAGAQQAGMATADFETFLERALFLDRDDPIAAWGD